MTATLRNVLVLGGSYVGTATAKELASILPATHRVLLVEPHSHFHHLFAFPRFAIVPNYEHKAFIPYSGIFTSAPNPTLHAVVKAKVTAVHAKAVTLDREWQGSKELPFDFLVLATGTRLTAPGTMPDDEKPPSVEYLQKYQQSLKKAESVVIIGGGAVGVQMACDLKEIYFVKEVTLVHSREKLMPVYHEDLSNIIKARFDELGVKYILGSRAKIPPGGFPTNGNSFDIELQNGTKVRADYAVVATGQTPNSEIVRGLEDGESAAAGSTIINPANGFVRVRPTMQLRDARYPHIFAVGDIADSGAHKAARPGAVQAGVVARNIAAMVGGGGEAGESIEVGPAGIHLTLGLVKNIVFMNPDVKAGKTEPFIKWRDDGVEDMGIEGVWERRGVKIQKPQEYHL